MVGPPEDPHTYTPTHTRYVARAQESAKNKNPKNVHAQRERTDRCICTVDGCARPSRMRHGPSCCEAVDMDRRAQHEGVYL